MEQWAALYFLEHSDPVNVFNWLKENQRISSQRLEEERDEIEQSLLVRNEPIINLGLALYGSDSRVGSQLYEKGNETIKKALASSSSVAGNFLSDGWVVGLLPYIMEEWNVGVLKELFSNQYLPDEILVDLFERKTPFSLLEEEEWIHLCLFASNNARLSKPYDSSWIDGFDEYKYNLVFTSAWCLFDKFPQTPLAAKVLERIGKKLIAHKPANLDLMSVIEKWHMDKSTGTDSYQFARSYLANLIPNYSSKFKELNMSNDIALRMAYYRNINRPNVLDVMDGFKKDGEEFINAALDNQHMFSNEEAREALKNICWHAPDDNDLFNVNYFNARNEYWIKEHPEWFKDSWEGELSFEEIEDKDVRLQKRVEHLNLQVNEIHAEILGDNERKYPSENSGAIERLKSELESVAELLIKIHQNTNSNSAAWAWGIAGASIGFAFAKY